MIPKECFVRRHFTVQKEERYFPLLSFEQGIEVGFQWGKESFFFTFEEKTGDLFQLSWPKYKEKDALLLFLDTRPSKKAHSLHRACHEFLILPEAVEGVQSKEITRFNSYETRTLLQDNVVTVHTDYGRGRRRYTITIPQEMLYGWEEDTKEISFACSYFSTKLSSPLHIPVPTVLPERIPYVWPLCHLERVVN